MTSRERVQIFLTETGVPRVLTGTLVSVEDDMFSVEFEDTDLTVSGSVVLNFPDSDRERVMTRLSAVNASVYEFQESRRVAPDKRNYPRLYAGLQVHYRLEGSDDWHQTDEYMNFSVSGLAFEGTGQVPSGSAIDLKIAMVGEEREWVVSGKVIRCDPLTDAEQQELQSGLTTNSSLAVAFTLVPADCREALEALTLRMLDV